MAAPRVAVFDSLGREYEQAFATFLAHTDQKDQARAWLDRAVNVLPQRRTFVDAGAGTGKVTAWYVPRFERTIAIEPNPHLRVHLQQACPTAEIVPATILEAAAPPADFVLNSHVFYYIPQSDWLAHVERLASFLAPDGLLVIVLQNSGTDCMKLVHRFRGLRFDLGALRDEFNARHDGQFETAIDTVASHVTTADFPPAYVVGEFLLNLIPLTDPPERPALEEYISAHFAAPGGGYRFSCSQDFLQIRRRAN
jgi:SAM-dependent methyltransferase